MIKKLTAKERTAQAQEIERVRALLGLGPQPMADAMGVTYDTYKNWTGKARAGMTAISWRVLWLLEDQRRRYPTAERWYYHCADSLNIRD